jgi:hypothetical protein
MFLFSGRGYWQELESIVWAHNKLKVAPAIQPRALSTQGRAVGVAHYLLGGIATTWAFFEARIISLSSNKRPSFREGKEKMPGMATYLSSSLYANAGVSVLLHKLQVSTKVYTYRLGIALCCYAKFVS